MTWLKNLAKRWKSAFRSKKQSDAALTELIAGLSREVQELGTEIRHLRGERDHLFQDIRDIMLQKCGDVELDQSIEATEATIPPRNTSTPELFAVRNWETWKPPTPKIQRAASYPPLQDDTAEIFFGLLRNSSFGDGDSRSSGSSISGNNSPRHKTAWRKIDRSGRPISEPHNA